jgi:polysaccharide export outer membrane protein
VLIEDAMSQYPRRILPVIIFLFLSFFCTGSFAAEQKDPTPTQTAPEINQLLQSDPKAYEALQQGVESIKRGQVGPGTLQQLRDKFQQENLIPPETGMAPDTLQELREKIWQDKIPSMEGMEGMEVFRQTGEEKEEEETGLPEEEQKQQKKKETERESERAETSSFFQRIFGMELPELNLFGHAIFKQSAELAKPLKNTPVPADYLIGPGDVFNVLIWGRLDASYELEVDNEGVINFPKIGPLTVAGLSYKEAKDLIIRKAEAITGVNISVSMGRLRTMQVFVLGEVAKPGLHTISSLATVINGLLAAGGPTQQGSLRHVQVKRQGETIAHIDLYDFLLQGDVSKDLRLMPADVVFVPRVTTLVALTGNVGNPAVYELQDNDRSLHAALSLAGGLAPQAYDQRIQIKRASENQEEIVLDVPFAELGEHEQVVLQSGDVIDIFPLLAGAVNAVKLLGNVKRPGPYAFKEGMRLGDLIADASILKDDTYFDYGLIRRYNRATMSPNYIPFNLGALLADPTGEADVALMPLDEVKIFNKWKFVDKPVAAITGEVHKPGLYEVQGMRVRDLIFQAGGLTRSAFMKIGHLFRSDPPDMEVSIHSFDLDRVLAGDPEHNLLLQDRDRLVVHNVWEYADKYLVSIQGEVNRPGPYPYAANMTIRDLILVAGNIKESAYLENGEVVRSEIVDGKKVQTSLHVFDLAKVLSGDPEHNAGLQPWDVVNIKKIPEWGESKNVSIEGEVLFPGTYSIRKGEKLSTVIERAGGFAERAYFRGAIFTRESVRILQQERLDDLVAKLAKEMAQVATSELAGALSEEDVKGEQAVASAQQSLLNRLRNVKATGRVVIKLAPGPAFAESNYNLVLEDEDKIIIPPRPDTVSVAGEVYNPTSLIYDSNNPEVGHYLALTGGPSKYANAKEIFILRADGTVVSKNGGGYSQPLFSGFDNTPLYPGDTIVVPPKLLHTRLKREIKDITSIMYEIAVSAGIIINQVFQ